MSLKEELNKKKPVIGVRNVEKKIRDNKISKVYVATNFKGKESISKLGKINGIEIEIIGENSKQLGVLCKKPFNICVIGFQ